MVWRFNVLAHVALGVRLQRLAGEDRTGAVPLIMCLWNRPQRLGEVLRQLSVQEDAPPIRLILWNNKRQNDALYLREIEAFGAPGALASIEFYSSRWNVGGIARFIVAHGITRRSTPEPFLMLDDDQNVSSHFVRDLLDAFAPNTYAGFWAFVIVGNYWERAEAAPGQQATYVGTGGSVCDSSIVRERGFFTRLPGRFAFIEDLWTSAFAASRGWRVEKVDTPIELTLEDSNQYLAMIDLKQEFWEYLKTELAKGRAL
ncbi:hypothetical protein LG299_15420 [Microbacterium lacus]|uniref:hypothetical protein n=1 Tax=Microbacterium lacus TaxID=415217 RepID=UPI003850DA73